MHTAGKLTAQLTEMLKNDDRPAEERSGLVRLMNLFAQLPPPPEPHDLYPRYAQLKAEFLDAIGSGNAETLEGAFLMLYGHVHGYDVPFTADERDRFLKMGGYLNHVGGLSPLLKAGPHIGPDTVSADFGSGNGLQGLLLQFLYPHRKTVQIEISSRLTETGRTLQHWLGIADERVEWVVGDISETSPADMDFIYIYRPVRPDGPGRAFYEHFAAELDRAERPAVIFSVADCLRSFLSPRFETFYSDGHLTCFGKRGRS